MDQTRPLAPHDYRWVGPFQILRILGHGGQGTVYLGRRTIDGQLAAVKILRFNHDVEAARRQLRREIANAQRVPQHWTARIIGWNVDGETPFVATEYIEGQTLADLVAARGPLPPERLYRLAVQTIDALEVIHAHNVVHRDFKPGNVMRGPDGWVVIDFGVSRVVGATQATRAQGTLAYMAPEQFSGRDEYATDLFAWAATMVYAATGRLAFGRSTEQATIHSILYDAPDLHGLGGHIGAIVSRCFNKEPSERPAISEVRAWLRTREPIEAVAPGAATTTDLPTSEAVTRIRPAGDTPSLLTRPPRPTRRWRRPAAFVVACVLVLALLAGGLWAGVKILGGRGVEPGTAASAPPDLRAFAPTWPRESFRPAPLRAHQAEKWGSTIGNVTVSLVRYDGRESFESERENVRVLHRKSPSTADWKEGTGADAAGHQGPYIEYQVLFNTPDGGDTFASLWWDASYTEPNLFATVILQTRVVEDPQQALDVLREVWRNHEYSGP